MPVYNLRSISESALAKQPLKLIELKDGKPDEGIFLEADAVVQENYSKSVNVTTYPVEKGNDIGEHANVSAFTITITGISSDASMSYFNLKENVANSAVGRLFNTATKSQAVWTLLNRWADTGTPLQVKAKFAKSGFVEMDYENPTINDSGAIVPFVIESLSVPRNKDIGAAINYTITLRRIRQVEIGTANFVDTRLGTKDTGAQQLNSNSKSSAVEKQPSTIKKTVSLRDGNPGWEARNPFLSNVGG